MKPKRIALAHELIVGYGIYKDLNVYVLKFNLNLDLEQILQTFHKISLIKNLKFRKIITIILFYN